MVLQESGEMYLETILILSENGKSVRSIDVAEQMHFSKPSVSRAMSKLREGGYILMDKTGYITLTETGKSVAEMIYERHVVLSAFFKSIGLLPMLFFAHPVNISSRRILDIAQRTCYNKM